MRRCSDEALLQPIDTARSQIMVCLKPLLPLQYPMVFKTHNKLPRRICPRSASCLSSPGAGPAQCSAQTGPQPPCNIFLWDACLLALFGTSSWSSFYAETEGELRNLPTYISKTCIYHLFYYRKKYPQNLIQFEIGTLVLAKIFRIALFVWRDPRFF